MEWFRYLGRKLKMRTNRMFCALVFAVSVGFVANLNVYGENVAVYDNINADEILSFAFPTPSIPVSVEYSYQTRTNGWLPKDLNEAIEEYANWHLIGARTNESFQIRPDGTESYWLGVLRDGKQLTTLLSTENTARIEILCSNFCSEGCLLSSALKKALFQRDLFQFYYVLINCTNAPRVIADRGLFQRRDRLATVLGQVLRRLALSNREYETVTNDFQHALARAMAAHRFEESNAFDRSHDFLPLRQALQNDGWQEMRFGASENVHFNHYRGRSFIRVFARTPGWNMQQFYSYWDEINRNFGDRVHLSADVPSIPGGTQMMLLRTFAVLMKDGTIADSGIPEEILIRAFRTSRNEYDSKSSDYRGTYFYIYKMSRRLLLQDPDSLGLVRHSEDDPAFAGFDSDVPTLSYSRRGGSGVRTVRQQCIECHALARYGSATIFSLEHKRLEDSAADQFSGVFLQSIVGQSNRYVFGERNRNLHLEQ